ncbi:2782_t:CDS:2 [Entrophospora sp. SA101]|nr:2782_t:CDS:2 [Entrophospora sp. SA101]
MATDDTNARSPTDSSEKSLPRQVLYPQVRYQFWPWELLQRYIVIVSETLESKTGNEEFVIFVIITFTNAKLQCLHKNSTNKFFNYFINSAITAIS